MEKNYCERKPFSHPHSVIMESRDFSTRNFFENVDARTRVLIHLKLQKLLSNGEKKKKKYIYSACHFQKSIVQACFLLCGCSLVLSLVRNSKVSGLPKMQSPPRFEWKSLSVRSIAVHDTPECEAVRVDKQWLTHLRAWTSVTVATSVCREHE